jgi:hypothetical protein
MIDDDDDDDDDAPCHLTVASFMLWLLYQHKIKPGTL